MYPPRPTVPVALYWLSQEEVSLSVDTTAIEPEEKSEQHKDKQGIKYGKNYSL